LKSELFHTTAVHKIKKTNFMSSNVFYFENRTVYEITREKNISTNGTKPMLVTRISRTETVG